ARVAAPAPVPELADRVARVRGAFRARGAQPFEESTVMFLRQGGARGVTLRVERPQCLGFTAVGMPEMGNLDLRVLNAEGIELGHDLRDDAHPFARACVTAPATLFVMATAVLGAGEVAVLAMANPPALPPPLGDVLRDRPRGVSNGVRTPRGALGRDPAVRPPAQAIETALASLGARGYRREGAVVNGNMPRGRSEQHPWDLVAGRCYTAIAFGGERVEDIDLVVRAPSGEVLGQDVGLDARPEVTFCAAGGGLHAVELRLFSGSGDWSLAVAEAPTPDPMLGPGALPDRLRAAAVAIDASARADGWAVALPPMLGTAWIGAEHRVPVELRGGECYRYAAVASSPPGVVDLWLTRPDGALLSAYTGARSPAEIWACPARTTRAYLHARTPTGRGEFALWGYRQEAPR
ncbi:MAG: hypothetical protein Q8S73_34890, partial [Deltaproteobacteria bacterium]|nr:hypothetical protein [Deltaproteobacteria bacterium]